ncbi:MAG: hypothetical protein GXO76_08015 [Calditrichaeota bacterium]|nr:hypothetical protein [Calditrichota bacterium]
MKGKHQKIGLSLFLLIVLGGFFSLSAAQQKSDHSIQKLQVVTLKITGMT